MKKLWLFLFVLLAIAPAFAEQKVEVLETWPAAQDVQLAPNQLYYVRVAYRLDSPTHIWVRPYFRGKAAAAGSNPTQESSGSGETLGWFFLLKPDAQVDEIRVSLGNGGGRDVLVQSVPVHIVGGAGARDDSPPAWVTELQAQADAKQKAAMQAELSKPVGAGDMALFAGFLLVVVGLALAGVILPIWAMRRWRGGWRIAAALPLVALGLTIVNIAIGVMVDPTSHNLFPFEILSVSVLGVGALLVMFIVRKLLGVGKENNAVDD